MTQGYTLLWSDLGQLLTYPSSLTLSTGLWNESFIREIPSTSSTCLRSPPASQFFLCRTDEVSRRKFVHNSLPLLQ